MQKCYDVVLSFKEALSILKDTSDVNLYRFEGGKFKASNKLRNNIQSIYENAYGWSFTTQSDANLSTMQFAEWDSDNSRYIFKDLFNDLVDFLFQEFGDSFCLRCPSEDDSDYISYSTLFLDNFTNLIIATYDKYNVLYTAYQTEKTQLLRGVKGTYTGSSNSTNTGSSSNSGYSKQKDTPQNAVSLASLDSDNYNTSVNVNSGESSNSQQLYASDTRTAVEERDTPIARLKEIEDKYKNILKDWSEEFIPLFWEV